MTDARPALPPFDSSMRHLLVSPDLRAGAAEMLPANIGLLPFGLVCGVGSVAAGADWLGAWGMAAIMFSGAAQILAAQLLAADAPLAIIVLTSFVMGLRFLMYSAAMAPHLRALPPRWQQTLAFLLTDQAFAATIRRFDAASDPRNGALYFLGAGGSLWLCWQVSCMAGFFAGFLVPASWSLEFAVPLCFIALIAPLMRNVPSALAAVVAGVAVMLLSGLPMRLNLVVAGLLGIVAATLLDLANERRASR